MNVIYVIISIKKSKRINQIQYTLHFVPIAMISSLKLCLCIFYLYCLPPVALAFPMHPVSFRSGFHRTLQQRQTLPELNEKKNDDHDNYSSILKLASKHFSSQALRAMVELGIPDILGENTMSIDEIAEQLGPSTNKDALLRTLRLLSGDIHILKELEGGYHASKMKFELTATGRLLFVNDNEAIPNLTSCIQHWTEKPLWNAWLYLPEYIKGEDDLLPFDRANGISSDHYYSAEKNPQSLQFANDFVRAISDAEIQCIVNGYDWNSLSHGTIVDIGGHHGKVLERVARMYPDNRYICLDLPEVISSAKTFPVQVELMSGDAFESESIPMCDVILLKHFLDRCMWDEQDSLKILKSCHSALPAHGKLLIADAVIPDAGKSDQNNTLQLHMDALYMLVGRGRQRTESEWTNLVMKAEFQVERVVDTSCPSCSIIILTKI